MQNKLAGDYCENNRERFKNNAYKPPLPAAYMSFHKSTPEPYYRKKNLFYSWPEYICLRTISHSSPLHSSILFSCCSNIEFQDFSGIVAFSKAQINTNSLGFVNNDGKNPYIEGASSSKFVWSDIY